MIEFGEMAKATTKKSASSYRTIGRSYDGIAVLAPKTRSKTFTQAEVREEIRKALVKAGVAQVPKPLSASDAPRVNPREDGRYEVRRPGKKRASAVADTQKSAIDRAREIDPSQTPLVKRVRKSPSGRKGTLRKP